MNSPNINLTFGHFSQSQNNVLDLCVFSVIALNAFEQQAIIGYDEWQTEEASLIQMMPTCFVEAIQMECQF